MKDLLRGVTDAELSGGLFHRYGVAHEQFAWDIRSEPAVIDVFASIWGTEELLVSFGEYVAIKDTVNRSEAEQPLTKPAQIV